MRGRTKQFAAPTLALALLMLGFVAFVLVLLFVAHVYAERRYHMVYLPLFAVHREGPTYGAAVEGDVDCRALRAVGAERYHARTMQPRECGELTALPELVTWTDMHEPSGGVSGSWLLHVRAQEHEPLSAAQASRRLENLYGGEHLLTTPCSDDIGWLTAWWSFHVKMGEPFLRVDAVCLRFAGTVEEFDAFAADAKAWGRERGIEALFFSEVSGGVELARHLRTDPVRGVVEYDWVLGELWDGGVTEVGEVWQ